MPFKIYLELAELKSYLKLFLFIETCSFYTVKMSSEINTSKIENENNLFLMRNKS